MIQPQPSQPIADNMKSPKGEKTNVGSKLVFDIAPFQENLHVGRRCKWKKVDDSLCSQVQTQIPFSPQHYLNRKGTYDVTGSEDSLAQHAGDAFELQMKNERSVGGWMKYRKGGSQ